MLNEMSHTEKDKYYMLSFSVESKKIQQTRKYNKKEADLQI